MLLFNRLSNRELVVGGDILFLLIFLFVLTQVIFRPLEILWRKIMISLKSATEILRGGIA